MDLPHNAFQTTLKIEQSIAALKANPAVEVDLAASKLFFDYEGDPEVPDHYVAFYERQVEEVIKIWGAPVYRGDWDSSDSDQWMFILPEHIDYFTLTVWEVSGKKHYLRVSWEDTELPIIVALGLEGGNCSDKNHW